MSGFTMGVQNFLVKLSFRMRLQPTGLVFLCCLHNLTSCDTVSYKGYTLGVKLHGRFLFPLCSRSIIYDFPFFRKWN